MKTAMGSTLERLGRIPLTSLAQAAVRTMHPSVTTLLIRDRLGWRSTPKSSRQHLDAAIQWICRAHDRCHGQGVSLGFSLLHGWLPPYPETTGYIIPTLFDYSE